MNDDNGLIELLNQNLDYFRTKPVNIPKITILLDHGYHPDKITVALQALYPRIMTKIRFQLAPNPTPAEKAAQGKTGFVPVATRWVIERSNAWMERCNSLVKNFERTPLMRLPSSISVLSGSCSSAWHRYRYQMGSIGKP